MLIIESGLLSWPACRILYTVLVIKPTHCDFNQSVSSANHQKSSASDCAYSVLRRYLLFIKKSPHIQSGDEIVVSRRARRSCAPVRGELVTDLVFSSVLEPDRQSPGNRAEFKGE